MNRAQKRAQKTLQRSRAVADRSLGTGGSKRRMPPGSLWRALAEDDAGDGMAAIRWKLDTLAAARDEYAGYPLPMDGVPLTIEPTYPRAAELMSIGRPAPTAEDDKTGMVVRNRFWSWQRRATIVVWEQDGKIDWGIEGYGTQAEMQIQTIMASDAWGVRQEQTAMDTLATLITPRAMRQYFLCGMFLERSPRSGVSYMFRKLRPTVALKDGPKGMRVLAAICMHPIGYYSSSWAGVMTPTDDVIAHLMMMRADEHMLWRRSNQHPAWVREAGL